MKKIVLMAILAVQGCQSNNQHNNYGNVCLDHLGQPKTTEVVWFVQIEPKYPKDALDNNIKGHVKLSFTVDRNYRTDNIKILESIPSGVFDQTSLRALKRSRYKPKCDNGQLVEEPAEVTFTFDDKVTYSYK